MANKSSVLSEKEIREIVKRQYKLKVVKDIRKITDQAITAFYNDYSPEYYHRVFGLKNLYKVHMKDIPYGFEAKFDYDYSHITGHNTNTEYIFAGPFVQGFHGGPHKSDNIVEGSFTHIKSQKQYEPALKMTPSPWDMIYDYVDNYEL